MANYATEHIRTVALVGHGSSGKTTLAEALLVKSGALPAAGTVERGTTVSDFDPLEKQYLHSLRSSLLHCEINGTRVHLIDTPGFPDFIGQSIGALDAVETAAVGNFLVTSADVPEETVYAMTELLFANLDTLAADNTRWPSSSPALSSMRANRATSSAVEHRPACPPTPPTG